MTPEQLKASILQYAIQGKLVEQRPEEGTAEELYREIKNIHLDNIEMYKNNPEKRNLWDLVHNIIKQTNSEGTFADLWNKNLLK